VARSAPGRHSGRRLRQANKPRTIGGPKPACRLRLRNEAFSSVRLPEIGFATTNTKSVSIVDCDIFRQNAVLRKILSASWRTRKDIGADCRIVECGIGDGDCCRMRDQIGRDVDGVFRGRYGGGPSRDAPGGAATRRVGARPNHLSSLQSIATHRPDPLDGSAEFTDGS
jgi:hypothetical protein